MGKPLLRVMKSGLFSTVQDLGRFGYQKDGVSPAGAMDPYSMQLANLLVGNERNAAALELTMVGPTLLALDTTSISICGGNLSPEVNGSPVPMWKSLTLEQGQVLSFGTPTYGARAYLSVAGGISVPVVMGSRSTHTRTGLGGLEGRQLIAGDVIRGEGEGTGSANIAGIAIHNSLIPQYSMDISVRVVLGSHLDAFTEEGVQTLLSSPYQLTPNSDRMGYRLTGAAIEQRGTGDVISDSVPFGGIQVPASGQPIILMADRQVTGGYARIGTVISVDLPRLAQALPNSTLHFSAVSVEEAQELYIRNEKLLRRLFSAVRLRGFSKVKGASGQSG